MTQRETVAVRSEDAPSKRALIASALRLFVSKGVCETTIREVAKDAGFTNPALFKFFRSRDDLALCVFERCYERLADALLPSSAAPTFEARLRSIVTNASEFMDKDLAAFLFVTEQLRLFWPKAGPTLRERSILSLLHDLYLLGKAEGRVSADHDVGLLVAAMVGTMTQLGRGLYFRELEGPAVRRAPELERLFVRMAW